MSGSASAFMTDEDKKRVLQIIISEIRADHTDEGLNVEFRPRRIWEPYVEAVLARQRQEQVPSPAVITSERKTGLEEPLVAHRIAFRQGWLELEAA